MVFSRPFDFFTFFTLQFFWAWPKVYGHWCEGLLRYTMGTGIAHTFAFQNGRALLHLSAGRLHQSTYSGDAAGVAGS